MIVRFQRHAVLCLVALAVSLSEARTSDRMDRPGEDSYRAAIEADWTAQERRLGRTVESAEAIQNLLLRADRLIEALERTSPALDLGVEKARLDRAKRAIASGESSAPAARRSVYLRARDPD